MRHLPLIAPLVIAAATLLVGSFTLTGADVARCVSLLFVLGASLPLAALWLLSAWGLGIRCSGDRVETDDAGRPIVSPWERGTIQLAVGVVLLLLVDAIAGRLGLLDHPVLAALILVPGVGIAARRLLRIDRASLASFKPAGMAVACALAAAAPALTVLTLAAASTPGWLWASEFGGYDALSYHLALPREWIAAGRLAGLEHNVYSFLPSGLEGAYMHLLVLRGDAAHGAIAAQCLHALLAVATAAATGLLAARRLGPGAGVLAFALVLGTPWTLVTGSLAYNEMGAAFLLAAGLLALDAEPTARRAAVTVGACCGGAALCKLTSAGFVALPLLGLLALASRRRAVPNLVTAGLVAGVVLLPWLWDNARVTGNAVFPFLPALGTGHWSADQAAIWAQGHAAPGGLGGRLADAWAQFMRYGIGSNPKFGEPWRPQWLVLPWLALAGALLASLPTASLGSRAGLRSRAQLLAGVVALQLALWIMLTHVQSRFMMPAVVPLALLAALAVALVKPLACRFAPLAIALGFAWCVPAVVLFTNEAGHDPTAAIDAAAIFDGSAHAAQIGDAAATEAMRQEIRDIAPATYWVNHALPEGSRVLLVGEARSLHFDLDRIVYQTTWDRGPLSRAMAASTAERDWIGQLVADGFTHVLVDTPMLKRWEASGWNDPALTARRVIAALEPTSSLLVVLRSGARLYALVS